MSRTVRIAASSKAGPWPSSGREHEVTAAVGAVEPDIAGHTQEPWRVRGRCLVQIDLAGAHLLGNDRKQAAAVVRDALRTAAEVRSTRTLDRLRTLQRQARPLRAGSPHLRELDERITHLLTRTTAHRDGATTA